jgi:hypothetical protein
MEKLLTMKFENIRSNLEFPFILIFFISASKSIEGYLGSESLNCFNSGYDKGRTNNHIIAPKQSFPLTKIWTALCRTNNREKCVGISKLHKKRFNYTWIMFI